MPPRDATVEDYRERINRVIFHIEAHLDEPLMLVTLAQIACFSPFHFHRIFAAFTGETLAGFIRRLRLERAAYGLLHLDAPVTEIALGAGYETHSAFTRAFVALFGLTPSAYRQRHEPFALRGAQALPLGAPTEEPLMSPEIRTIAPMSVLFVRRTGPYGQAAGEAFAALCQFAGPLGLLGPDTRFIGISHDDPHVTEPAKFRYDACLSVARAVTPEGEIGAKTIEGGKYAVFLHRGAFEGFQQTYDQIFRGWLPSTHERLREAPSFEVYLNSPDQVPAEDLRAEIWLPLE
ncbi:AraC family transcriptional regulator [Myxococcota bacterium]|nr:AraC family transcriptional regulator [Myxococcota bacterium]MBU1430090.1 AraC family transcriptional regulator [Myxococcota bacterium]MBU1899541.1 AraC family transcriptional regulator [Myxococcota bacterium]